MLMIFEQVSGEQVMLPVMLTSFESGKDRDGNRHTVAKVNGELFFLKDTIEQIQATLVRATQPVPSIQLPKDLRGFSGV